MGGDVTAPNRSAHPTAMITTADTTPTATAATTTATATATAAAAASPVILRREEGIGRTPAEQGPHLRAAPRRFGTKRQTPRRRRWRWRWRRRRRRGHGRPRRRRHGVFIHNGERGRGGVMGGKTSRCDAREERGSGTGKRPTTRPPPPPAQRRRGATTDQQSTNRVDQRRVGRAGRLEPGLLARPPSPPGVVAAASPQEGPPASLAAAEETPRAAPHAPNPARASRTQPQQQATAGVSGTGRRRTTKIRPQNAGHKAEVTTTGLPPCPPPRTWSAEAPQGRGFCAAATRNGRVTATAEKDVRGGGGGVNEST